MLAGSMLVSITSSLSFADLEAFHGIAALVLTMSYSHSLATLCFTMQTYSVNNQNCWSKAIGSQPFNNKLEPHISLECR